MILSLIKQSYRKDISLRGTERQKSVKKKENQNKEMEKFTY
jgi:hypothetical protein